MEQYLIGGVIGVAFGFAVSCLSARLTRNSMKKSDSNAVLGASMMRTGLDLLALLAVYLLREKMPFPFYGVIVGTASGLSVGNIIQASRLSKQVKKEHSGKKSGTDEVK